MQKAITVLERVKSSAEFKTIVGTNNPSEVVNWLESQLNNEEELLSKSKKKNTEVDEVSPMKKIKESFIEKLKMRMTIIQVSVMLLC